MYESNQGHTMNVNELRAQLEDVDGDMLIEAMFSDGSEAYSLFYVEVVKLSQGRTIAVLDIGQDTPLRAV